MNFKKSGIVSRKSELEERLSEDLEPRNQVLAVWGSPGCGKTMTAVKLLSLIHI